MVVTLAQPCQRLPKHWQDLGRTLSSTSLSAVCAHDRPGADHPTDMMARMTTPPPTGPPSIPPGGGVPPAPQAVARPRNRRTMVAVVVSVLVLVGGAVTAWWLTRDGDGSSPADRPRVTDDAAGISYAIPE